jgi:hypothetical protein
MRSFLLFALALTGLAILTDDVTAGIIFGRRNRGRTAYSTGYSAPVAQQGAVGYGQQPGYMPSSTDGTPPSGLAGVVTGTNPNMTGQAVIQATDGTYYYRGADGSYYATPQGSTGQQYYTGQPYYGNNPGRYRTRGGYYTSPGVYQAGYPGTQYYNPGVIQTGGVPLQMPAVPVPMPIK